MISLQTMELSAPLQSKKKRKKTRWKVRSMCLFIVGLQALHRLVADVGADSERRQNITDKT